MDTIIKERRLDEIAALLRQGVSQREAAEKLNIPKSTLNDRYKLIKTKFPYLLEEPSNSRNFIFHESFYDTYQLLRTKSKDTALLYLDSILEYAFNNTTPDEDTSILIYTNFLAAQFQIDSDNGRSTL